MESNIQRQSKPPMAGPSSAKPLPPKPPSVRRSQQAQPAAAQVESIYNFKEPQPNVVVYDANQMSAPEPVREAPKQRKPGVPLLSGGRARASSVQNRAAQNAGRQILSSQQSNKQLGGGIAPKDAVPRASDVSKLNPRQQKNHVKANMNKAIFDL